jgi:hypothetical protein
MALPIAGGVVLGRYLDSRLATGASWTLALLGAGLALALIELAVAFQRVLESQRHD